MSVNWVYRILRRNRAGVMICKPRTRTPSKCLSRVTRYSASDWFANATSVFDQALLNAQLTALGSGRGQLGPRGYGEFGEDVRQMRLNRPR